MIQEIAPGRIDSDAVEPGETSGSEPQPRLTDGGVLRAAAARYAGTLDKTLRSAVIPYGYTVTVWASGAYLISLRGLPSGLEAFAFVGGATLAFGVLASMSQWRPGPIDEPTIAPIHPDSRHPLFAAGLHIAAVGLAFGAATLIDRLLGNLAWFLASFAVTFIYLLIASAELAISVELNQREIGLERARVMVRRRRKAIREVVRRR
jgi:hypothetical protein